MQFLPVPELMPFRLTRQFINLMLPMKELGLLYNVMVHSLRAYRADQDFLINTMDVFVKEPSLDWKVGSYFHPGLSKQSEEEWLCECCKVGGSHCVDHQT